MSRQPQSKTVDRAQQPGDRRIIIKPEAFGAGFDVIVDPPIEGHPLDREFPEHRQAFGYASGLRMTLGFPVIDQAGGCE